METIEHKVAESILQTAKDSITIAGQTYEFGKPTVATVIMCSHLISLIPEVRQVDPDNIAYEMLRVSKDMNVIGEIAAVLILGAKRVAEHRKVRVSARRDDPNASSEETIEIEEKDALAENILLELSVKELSSLITGRLTNLGIGDFFVLTTSLAEANILKPTRSGVGDETTASGQ